MAITSLVCDISMQSLVLRYGSRGVTMATNFGIKFATNAFL